MRLNTNKLYFSTLEARAITGMTKRQFQYWTDDRVLRPVRDGHNHFYSVDDLVLLRVIVALRSCATGRRLRNAIRIAQTPETSLLLVETKEFHEGLDPRRKIQLRWVDSEQDVIEIATAIDAGVQLIDIGAIRSEIEARL